MTPLRRRRGNRKGLKGFSSAGLTPDELGVPCSEHRSTQINCDNCHDYDGGIPLRGQRQGGKGARLFRVIRDGTRSYAFDMAGRLSTLACFDE